MTAFSAPARTFCYQAKRGIGSVRMQFRPSGSITVQPGDQGLPFSFVFEACSSELANDGALPYGTTIENASVTAVRSDGEDATSDLVQSVDHSDETVVVTLRYPPNLGAGTYRLTFLMALSSGAVLEADFARVVAADR
jgi:hypothetical protein